LLAIHLTERTNPLEITAGNRLNSHFLNFGGIGQVAEAFDLFENVPLSRACSL